MFHVKCTLGEWAAKLSFRELPGRDAAWSEPCSETFGRKCPESHSPPLKLNSSSEAEERRGVLGAGNLARKLPALRTPQPSQRRATGTSLGMFGVVLAPAAPSW